ncbi:ribonuclease H protein [Trifolium medium]|uniref:Ribonuclease H protein n=1 Tax=Trifolium medium TaxID=97028 RepID=A0A392M1Z6_9FABA|nr:ribonuclease H protein [Trifolium medium]
MITSNGASFSWLDQLSVNEQVQVEELTELLLGFVLQPGVPDRWCWIPGVSGLFSVKSCYNTLLLNRPVIDLDPNVMTAVKELWINDITSKVAIFGWRLLQERLPTREALHHRGILHNPHELSCAFCVLVHEDCAHLFFRCPFSKKVWQAVYNWIGKSLSADVTGWHHFMLFGDLLKGKKRERYSHLIWLATTWHLWKHRNNVVFNGVIPAASSLMDDIKATSWMWVSGRLGHRVCFSFLNWCIDPIGCLQSSL